MRGWGFVKDFMSDRLNAAAMESEWFNESQLSRAEIFIDKKQNNEEELFQQERDSLYQNWNHTEQRAEGCEHRYWRTCGCLSKEGSSTGE